MADEPGTSIERERIRALDTYAMLDSPADPAYDAIAALAAKICDVPIALIGFLDADRNWLKANVGLAGLRETPRDVAFCSHAIDAPDGIMVVPDARLDPRFADNPFVRGQPHLRFYAGVPLVMRGGHAIGTLCVFDDRPRDLTAQQRDALTLLASSLVTLIESRSGMTREQLTEVALVSGALEHAAQPIMILKLEKSGPPILTYVNAACATLFEYRSAELIGRTIDILHGLKTDPHAIRLLVDDVDAGRAGTATVLLYTASGRERLIEIRDRAINASHRIVNLNDLTTSHAERTALLRSNERLRSLLANNADAVFTIDTAGACIDANAAAVDLFGYERDALPGIDLTDMESGLFPGAEAFPAELASGRTLHFATTYRRRDRSPIVAECTAVPIRVESVTEGAYVLVKDVTESARLASFASEQGKRTHALCTIAAASGGTDASRIDASLALVLDALDMQFAYVGEKIGDTLHVRNVVGQPLVTVEETFPLENTLALRTIVANDVLSLDDVHDGRHSSTARLPDWHGFISAPLVIDGETYGTIAFLSRRVIAFNAYDRDFVRLVASLVSSSIERQVQKERLDRLAYFDLLTRLPNRTHFLERLEAALANGIRHDQPFAVHYIDLDGFKGVNDALGHATGDLVLQEAARRLKGVLRREDLPARFGGDEFVALQTAVMHPREARTLGERIVASLSRPYDCARSEALGASVGVAIFPEDGRTAKDLLRNADLALYRAKTTGKGRAALSDDARVTL